MDAARTILWPKFTRFRGDTKRLRFALTDDQGNIVKPDDCTLFFSLDDLAGNPLVQKQSTIGGFTTIDNDLGIVDVEIVPDDDAELANNIDYDCALVAQNGTTGAIHRIRGTVKLIDGILDTPAITLPVTTTNPALGFTWANVVGIPAQIAALAALATNGLIARTAAGTLAALTLTAGANIAITHGDGVGGNPTIAVTGLAAVATSGAKADVGLGSVENTALSTWAGTSNLTTLGTIATGVWHGSVVAATYGGTGATSLQNNFTVASNVLSLASALTGINAITAATNTDLTLTPGGATNNVVIGNTANQTSRLDLGTGPTPSASPGTAYFQPLNWGPGSKYYLTGGYSLFTTAAYPAGIYDYLGGIGYNSKNSPVSGDAQFGLGFEARYQYDPAGADTEHYYYWNGPIGVSADSGGRTTRRVYQSNTSWGTAYAAPVGRPMGYSNWSFDVNNFSIYNGAGGANPALSMDFGNNSGTQANYTFHWWGGQAARFDGGLSTTNLTSNVSTGTSSIGGNTTISSGNATFNFSTGAGNDAIYSSGTAVNGDTALRLGHANFNSTDYMAFGAAANGSLFGTASGYYLDLVRGTSPAFPFNLRYSSNGGALASGTYTTAMTMVPNAAGQVAFPIATAAINSTTGGVIFGGGIGVAGDIFAGTSLNVVSGSSTNVKITATATVSTVALNRNAISNYSYLNFTYGATPTSLWHFGYDGYYPNTVIGFSNQQIGGGAFITAANNWLIGATATDMAGSYNLSVEGGVIDTRTTAAIVLKQNGTTALTIANSTLNATFASTTEATTGGAGSLTTAGGIYAAKKIISNTFLVATSGLCVGNSAAATTPGSVVKKIEVFDTAGTSLGFVPVYSAIT